MALYGWTETARKFWLPRQSTPCEQWIALPLRARNFAQFNIAMLAVIEGARKILLITLLGAQHYVALDQQDYLLNLQDPLQYAAHVLSRSLQRM